MAKITIKKGGVIVTADRKDLMEVSETHDGVSFNFKGGLQVYYTDNFMPNQNKQIIKNTADHFLKQKISFDLDNLTQPAKVDAT